MARIRYLKPEFFTDEHLGELSFQTRLTFAGIWCHADKSGRLEYRPKFLKAMIFPYDDINLENEIKKLQIKPFIKLYAIENKKYIQVVNWEKHQRPHNTEKESEIPPSTLNTVENTVEKEKEKGTEKGMEKGTLSVPDATPTLNNVENTLNKEFRSLSMLLFENIIKRNPKHKKPNFEIWDKEIRLLVEKDGKSPQEIIGVVEWCQADSFWQNNILSTSKLREKYDQLFLKMNQTAKKSKHDENMEIMKNRLKAIEEEKNGEQGSNKQIADNAGNSIARQKNEQ